jgi:hypothetical protein
MPPVATVTSQNLSKPVVLPFNRKVSRGVVLMQAVVAVNARSPGANMAIDDLMSGDVTWDNPKTPKRGACPKRFEFVRGDWICPNESCGGINTAHKATCVVCNTPRVVE